MEYCAKENIEQHVFVGTSAGINNFTVSCELKDKRIYDNVNNKKSAKSECSEKMC